MTPETLSIAALICFGAGAAAAVAGFFSDTLRKSLWQFLTCGLGLLLQTAAIGVSCAKGGNHFFSSSSEIFGLLAWALSFSYLVALLFSTARSLGALILPLIVILLVLAQALPREGTDPGIPSGSLLALHILSAFLGYGLFLTACGASVLYLEQSRLLKRKAFGILFQNLPSLERLEKLEILCAWTGLIAFTAALATGAVLAQQYHKPFWLEPKILSAQVTWLIFFILVAGSAVKRLNGSAAAKFVLAGAALVLLTFALSHNFKANSTAPGADNSPRSAGVFRYQRKSREALL